MANKLYDKGRENFLTGDIDWLNDNIQVVLLSSGYTYSNTHETLSEVDSGARVDSSEVLDGKTATDGVADANDTTITAVTGSEITQFILTQTTESGLLIAHFDSATGLPLTPNGGDITIQWDNGVNKIFKL